MIRKLLLVSFAAILLFVTACGLDLRSWAANGSIELDPGSAIRDRNIDPPLSMVCTDFEVTGVSATDSFGPIVITGITTIESLLPELYTVTAVGRNLDGTPIGEGSTDVDVILGATTPCNILVSEYDGDGTFHMEVDFDDTGIYNPGIDSHLVDSTGTETLMDFGERNGNATYELDIARGFYGLIFKVLDGTELIGGFVDVVRVVANQRTTGYAYVDVNQVFGGLEINIDDDIIADFLVMTPDVPEGVLSVDSGPVTVTIAETGNIYTWYVNGEDTGVTGPSFTADAADYTPGFGYVLSCLGWSTDGLQAGALNWTFTA